MEDLVVWILDLRSVYVVLGWTMLEMGGTLLWEDAFDAVHVTRLRVNVHGPSKTQTVKIGII